MKILLTGSTGFVGSELARVLLQQGHELILLARRDPWKSGSLLRDRVLQTHPDSLATWQSQTRWLAHDLSDLEALPQILRSLELDLPDVIAHLAAEIRYDRDHQDRVERINGGSSQILALWSESQSRPFLQMSSVVAWGGDWDGVLRSEKDFPESLGLCERFSYYKSKHRLHQWLLKRPWKNPVCLIAPGVVHGWGEDRKPTRRHLQWIRDSQLRWAPPGSVSLVSLHWVVHLCVEWMSSQPAAEVVQRLAVDQVMSLKSYFEEYSKLCGKPQKFIRIPQTLAWFLSFLGNRLVQLGPASLHHHFQSDQDFRTHRQKEESLKQALRESLQP